MSFTLIEQRVVKAARKQHQCIWCGNFIEAGESYTYERSIFCGQPQSHHWHPECLGVMQELAHENGGQIEFGEFENERPVEHDNLNTVRH